VRIGDSFDLIGHCQLDERPAKHRGRCAATSNGDGRLFALSIDGQRSDELPA